MSTVIAVENLSKRYILDHQAQERYTALRDVLANGAKKIARRLFRPSPGKASDPKHEEFWALRDVSFEIKDGERLGVIGRNGAGKSTLLKILSRITEPTSGRIHINGRVASLLEVGTGFHPELTGRENIYLNGAILGMSRAEIRRKFDEIVAFAEVEKFLDTPVKRYSSGMYVRLAFAVAAHLEPEILVVDEVLAVGDLQFQKKCLNKMESVGREGRTIIFVSHNLTAINSLCSRCVLMNQGRLTKDGPSAEVVSHYISAFGGKRDSIRSYGTDENKMFGQIRRVGIRNLDGEITESIDLNEDFAIQVDYEIRSGMSGFSVGIQIVLEETGQTIISLSDPELDLTRLGARRAGYYESHVIIPRKILNTGSYRVRVGLTRSFQICDVVEDVSFSVFDAHGIVQALGYERKNSVLSMQLPWEAKYIG